MSRAVLPGVSAHVPSGLGEGVALSGGADACGCGPVVSGAGAGCLQVLTGQPEADRITGLANALYFLFVALALAVPLARTGTSGGVPGRSWIAVGLMAAMAAGALAAGFTSPASLPPSVMMLPMVLLLAYTGGRAVPAFTAAWLSRSSSGGRLPKPLAAMPLLPAIAAAGLLEAADWPVAAGWLQLAAAGLMFAAVLRWRTVKTRHYPALLWLHVAYAWIPAAFLLQAVASWWPEMAGPAAGRHALAIGAMGGMMMAVMLRPSMQRRKGRLVMTPLMACSLALIQLSAVLRLCAQAAAWEANLAGAALAWALGWGLFIMAYWPAVTGPVPHPAFSALVRDPQDGPKERLSGPHQSPGGSSGRRRWRARRRGQRPGR